MTAVASPPSVQSGPRLGWYSAGNSGQGALASSSAEDVSRMFMSRKSVQRTNSSSSLASSLSSASTVLAHSQHSNAGASPNTESVTGVSKKKPSRYIWSSSKAEAVSGVTNTRSQAMSTPSAGPTASSSMSPLHHPSPIVPSQHTIQSPQQNGIRPGGGPLSNEPPAILSLLPMNGTFERKQINVPYYPEILKIGRQTNAKTIPTPVNGYFDSKVLSRQHAEVWADRSGKIWIRDVKSSNGTFVNGQRLSPENRESDPHELREHDTLELGIDIVSEDQKSIVHHKVSAKVEHAGVYGPNTSLLDLNFGDIDPTTGGGLLPPHLTQPLSHMRGRPGSSNYLGSNRSSQNSAGGHLNHLHQQRQMNYWLSPITIEQVVKKLSSEMKQAKQQSQDLNQTNVFLSSLISKEVPEKERSKPSPVENHVSRQANWRPKMPKLEPISRFSEPPAPPPQQPLPEKPDVPPRTISSDQSSSNPPLKRSDTEKPKLPGGSPESSQILSLMEALSTTQKQLEAQGARVKELEDRLHQERNAREKAEERVRRLEGQTLEHDPHSEIEAAFEPPVEPGENKLPEASMTVETIEGQPPTPSPDVSAPQEDVSSPDPSSDHLQQRLDSMVAEMEELRLQMENYKKSAEKAENDTAEARKSLAEMIEARRSERANAALGVASKSEGVCLDGAVGSLMDMADLRSSAMNSLTQQHRSITPSQITELENVATTLAKRHRANMLEQSAPYASMLGIVLLGVGIMAYLNGWQKMDK